MARLLKVLSCLLLVDFGSHAKSPPATGPSKPTGKFPFGGKAPDLSKLGKGSNDRRRDAKKPPPNSAGGNGKNSNRYGKGGKNQKTPEEIAKLREQATKNRGKWPDASKMFNKGKASDSKAGKAPERPDAKRWGKGKDSDSKAGKAPNPSKNGPRDLSKKGKAPNLPKWGKYAKGKQGLPDLSKRGKNGQGFGNWRENNKTKEFIEKQFKVMDSNQDGQVTSEELVGVVAALRKRAEEKGFDLTLDEKGRPKQSKWEGFERVETSLLQKTEITNPEKNGAAGWFKTVDENADGTLTLPEFEARMSSKLNSGKPLKGKASEL